MVTINQLITKSWKRKQIRFKKLTRFHLKQCPQKLAVCNKIRIMAPKKPNSAERQVARVRILSTQQYLTVFVPGGRNHRLQQFSNVLIRGGRVRDLPGIHYKIIRGPLDALFINLDRKQRRSKFGIKKPQHLKLGKTKS